MRTIARGPRVFPARGVPAQSHVGVQFDAHFESQLLLMVDMRLGEIVTALSLRGTTDHVFPLVMLVALR